MAVSAEEVERRLDQDTEFWAEQVGWIVDKRKDLVRFFLKEGQREMLRLLKEQRDAGLPQRLVALKARQVGISTLTQGLLIQSGTRRARREAITIANDKKLGRKLYSMGETFWRKLPQDMRPELGQHRRQQFLHFAGEGDWRKEESFPNSTYEVDTAGEYEAGRGGTPTEVHASEVAFWDQIEQKLTAVKNSMPKSPDTLFVIESTAKGFNAFKDIWDDAEAGVSGYVPFFWPWWREPEYKLAFLNDTEREVFVVGDPTHPYAEEEPELVKLVAGKGYELTPEQLNWRRHTIADECNGRVPTFHAEYPSTPEEAFIATGEKAFDPYKVASIVTRVELSDPRHPTADHAGPLIGDFVERETEIQVNRSGDEISVPRSALWVPRESGIRNPTAPHRAFLDEDKMKSPTSQYIVAVDVSGGSTETTDKPDYHAIEVLDHKTRVQVCEYRSRIDPDLLTREVLLVALWFNHAWVAVERTGSWGLPILRALWLDYHYPFVYRSKAIGQSAEKTERRLGWDTNVRTKPEMVSGMQALIRQDEDGIRSRLVADQARTYARDSKGSFNAEPGKFDDNLMALMIAQAVARELPLREDDELNEDIVSDEPFVAARAGLSAYDPRVG